MTINQTFNGATIYKPGSYSKSIIDLGGNIPLGPAGLIAIFGEADAGTNGASEIDISQNFYTADMLSEARAKYRSGPIMDALSFLFAPASDAAISNGAQSVWVYKTNASVRASKVLADSYGTVKAQEWGVGGNRITYTATASNTGQATTSGTPPNLGSALSSQSITFRANGADALVIFTFSAIDGDHDTIGEVVSEMNNDAGFSAVLIASNVGAVLTIKTKLDANLYKKGCGESFEIISGSALLGMTNTLKVATAEPVVSLTLNQKRDLIVETDILGGDVIFTIGRDNTGTNSTATVTVNSTAIILTDTNGSITINKDAYPTLKQVEEYINLQSGWTAAVSDAIYNQLSTSTLDQITDIHAFTGVAGNKPARLKKDAYSVASFFSASQLCLIESQLTLGLPGAVSEVFLSGGAKGATSTAEVIAALSKFEKFHCNSIIPLFSRDATDDINDNLTDAASTYTIAGIHQAVKTHISLMKSTKKRSERQGYLSTKSSFANAKTTAGNLADGRLQLFIQDVRQRDSLGTIKWFQPYALACLVAGARAGATIGTPLTNKYLNCSGIRHTAQSMNTPEASIVIDFDPDVSYEDAIISGITFLEAPRTGGYKIVVDSTTYGIDSNWVWNRGSVIYAGDIVAYNFRNSMESRYVGVKNTVTVAEVKSTAESILSTFLSQGITVSTGDAPNGYKNLSVRIDGSTIYVTVTIKLVEGIDFILSEITLQRAST
jgi:hypothetical protein